MFVLGTETSRGLEVVGSFCILAPRPGRTERSEGPPRTNSGKTRKTDNQEIEFSTFLHLTSNLDVFF